MPLTHFDRATGAMAVCDDGADGGLGIWDCYSRSFYMTTTTLSTVAWIILLLFEHVVEEVVVVVGSRFGDVFLIALISSQLSTIIWCQWCCMLQVGYGDIYPTNNLETCWELVVVLAGCSLFASAIGAWQALLKQRDETGNNAFKEKMARLLR